ncbi:MAG: hypothetical protein DYG94_00035 [Leptolyngbya sp. PLA3]|nr:MAG: hypothetical protein EDM82_01840 [Cyanobacteria bacterium CYA]MCE7967125.1 hypothetical protein [Leptolyngbya sp. PL-A3]
MTADMGAVVSGTGIAGTTATPFDRVGLTLAIVGAGLVIYVGGVVWIVLRRHKMRGPARAEVGNLS